jgi:hypothetical protein
VSNTDKEERFVIRKCWRNSEDKIIVAQVYVRVTPNMTDSELVIANPDTASILYAVLYSHDEAVEITRMINANRRSRYGSDVQGFFIAINTEDLSKQDRVALNNKRILADLL